MDDYDGCNTIRLISGDQKKVQMIPIDEAVNNSILSVSNSSTSTNNIAVDVTTHMLLQHSSQQLLVQQHESSLTTSLPELYSGNSSNGDHDDETGLNHIKLDEDTQQEQQDSYDEDGDLHHQTLLAKRVKLEIVPRPIPLALPHHSENTLSDYPDSPCASVDSSGSGISLETENTISSGSVNFRSGKKRKQSNPKKVISSTSSSDHPSNELMNTSITDAGNNNDEMCNDNQIQPFNDDVKNEEPSFLSSTSLS